MTPALRLQLNIQNRHRIFILPGSLTDQLNHSRRDNSIAAGPRAAGVRRSVEARRSIPHHAAQNQPFTVEPQLPERPGSSKANRVLQQEAGRGRRGRCSGRRFPFPSAPPPPAVAFEFVYAKAAFCVAGFDKAQAPADRSRYAPAPSAEKLICDVKCQPLVGFCQDAI